ncbi:MAG TPA: hypothetical protein VMN36_11935, partial [Verrucomicrobiales bacterium]|nr:hypothetical protein [Verrucomicrobiales bacterium]
MRRRGCGWIVPAVVLLTGPAGSGAGTTLTGEEVERRFAEANAFFEGGDARAALEAYEGIAQSGWAAPELFLNLAAAAKEVGNHGLSALGAYRALLLHPGDEETRELLRSALGSLNEEERFVALLSSAHRARWRGWLLWGGTAGFWLLMIIGAAAWLRIGARGFAIAALWAIPFVAMAGAGWWFCRGVPRPGSAWVTTPEPVELKAAPFEE